MGKVDSVKLCHIAQRRRSRRYRVVSFLVGETGIGAQSLVLVDGSSDSLMAKPEYNLIECGSLMVRMIRYRIKDAILVPVDETLTMVSWDTASARTSID